MNAGSEIADGVAHWRAGRLAEAEACFRAVLPDTAGNAELFYALAAVIHGQGRPTDAIEFYERAAALAPGRPEIANDLGAALAESGRAAEAIERLEVAVTLAPNDSDLLNNLGTAYLERDDAGTAAEKFRAALAIKPAEPVIAANLGRALLRRGDAEAAVEILEDAVRRFPGDGALKVLAATALPAIAPSHDDLARWRQRLEHEVAALADAEVTIERPDKVGGGTFLAAYHGLDDTAIQTRLAAFYARACPALAFTAPHCRAPDRRGGRCRVGFASAHFEGHTIGRLNRGLIDRLDRERFEVSVFELGPGRFADAFTARDAIAAAELDILYFTDIGMEPISYFLGYSRLAPVQCATWGHPVTTGLPEIDYFVSIDGAEPPGAEAHYSETLVRLPVFSTFVSPVSAAPKSRVDLGLPESANLYFCPQSLFKLHPDFDAALGGILADDPAAELVFVDGPQAHWRELLEARWQHVLDLSRVRFLPRMARADFLSALAAADVVLDTFPFCGGHTSYEALALAKPVVTLPGAFLRGRLTLAMLEQMGIEATVAGDIEDYVRIALAFGTDADAHAALSRDITERRALLFEDDRAVAAHERFFLEAAEKELR